MLPEPVIHAAQVLAMAIPTFAKKAYKMARAVEPCDEFAINNQISVNGYAARALLKWVVLLHQCLINGVPVQLTRECA